MLDIERVEVLRGPQGTLFGLSTEGGGQDERSRPARTGGAFFIAPRLAGSSHLP